MDRPVESPLSELCNIQKVTSAATRAAEDMLRSPNESRGEAGCGLVIIDRVSGMSMASRRVPLRGSRLSSALICAVQWPLVALASHFSSEVELWNVTDPVRLIVRYELERDNHHRVRVKGLGFSGERMALCLEVLMVLNAVSLTSHLLMSPS